MFNCTRKCLMNFAKSKVFTQVISCRITACSNKHYTNIQWFWNDTTCKRYYCQVAVQDVNIPKKSIRKSDEIEQQELDKFLSDPDNEKLFKVLQLEIDVLRHNAEKVPDIIKTRHWLELLGMRNRSQRKKYLDYLFCNEKSRENKKTKSEQRRIEWQANMVAKTQTEDTNEMKYGLSHNTLFLRIYQQNMNQFYHARLISSAMFEPKLVFDCSYQDYMTRIENHNCAKQLTLAFAANRIHDNPMFLHFCNLKEGILRQNFLRNMPNLLDEDFPAIVTSQSYLDLFPKDQLIYLTPHCKTDLLEYDSDMVYIIGAMVDKSNPKPLSLAKAKQEGLRMAKLPIERYLDWGAGSTKNFTLNQMLSIMLDLRHTKNWLQAFQHVPTRKLREAREYMLKRKIEYDMKLLKSEEEETETHTHTHTESDEIETSIKFAETNHTFTNRRNK